MNEKMKKNLLNDEELESVNGGAAYYIFNACNFVHDDDPNKYIELLDRNGNVVTTFYSVQDAENYLRQDQSNEWLYISEKQYGFVQALRGQK